jgi:hypothetical protein
MLTRYGVVCFWHVGFYFGPGGIKGFLKFRKPLWASTALGGRLRRPWRGNREGWKGFWDTAPEIMPTRFCEDTESESRSRAQAAIPLQAQALATKERGPSGWPAS